MKGRRADQPVEPRHIYWPCHSGECFVIRDSLVSSIFHQLQTFQFQSFLRDYLDEDTSKMEGEWKALEGYKNPNGISSVAEKDENMAKNRDAACLPCKPSLFSLLHKYRNEFHILFGGS